MNVRHLAAAVAMLAVVGVAMHQARSADSDNKDEAALEEASSDFAVRYAKAQLRLSELRLAKAQEMNRRVARTLAKGVIEQFADDVKFAKSQLEIAQSSGKSDGFTFWVNRAQLDLEDREEALQVAVQANKRVPGAFRDIDLDRLRAAVELAKLRVERSKQLEDASEGAKLVWQLSIMTEEINRVNEMVSLSLQNRLSEFF